MGESFKGFIHFLFFLTQKIWEKEKKYLPLHHQNNFKQTILCALYLRASKSPPR